MIEAFRRIARHSLAGVMNKRIWLMTLFSCSSSTGRSRNSQLSIIHAHVVIVKVHE